ncbi:LysM peptidoglycan-binding domain-containing protein [Aliifodinibius salicampi]|uniref:Curli production assembly/transport component CsgE n=1 Tax=Fodinibius salicampi TaxID=1920655 RepID=A0ABT3PYH7_9BACT|nr:CsgE family curli-type amyloid fiber assembly protein [Fodinibius salicampi]MCW9712893.1 LysM peptidoglycan-binding domain-containing protein [Fodinibius salicampi]
MGLRSSIIISFVATILFSTTLCAQDQNKNVPYQYTVKDGDYLISIAVDFGNPNYWEQIYNANSDKIKRPDIIYIGQKLDIPAEMVSIRDTALVDNPERLKKEYQKQFTDNKKEGLDKKTLNKFQKAFKKVVEQERREEKKQQTESSGQSSTIAIDGMVLDETRSKMGTDFYNVFYRHWEPPSKAKNFMITISEQPTPGRGSVISISIDNEKVFQNRLQPKYAYTEKVAKHAVAICYRSLLRQQSSSNAMLGY